MKDNNNSVLLAPEISEKDPDRNDPDWMYRYVGTGISTRPDPNCGRGDFMGLVR
jgi:hypothetical protein